MKITHLGSCEVLFDFGDVQIKKYLNNQQGHFDAETVEAVRELWREICEVNKIVDRVMEEAREEARSEVLRRWS